MVTAPVMVLLYDRIFLAGSFRQVFARRKWLYAGLAATWGVLAALVGPSLSRGGGSAGVGQGVSVWSYVMTQFDAVARYLRLAFWPNTLVLDYGTGLAGSFAEVAGAAALIAGLLVAGALLLWWRPRAGFLAAWFFVILAPSSSFIPVVTQTSAEHRVYLSLAALAVAAAMVGWWGLARAWARLFPAAGRWSWAAPLAAVSLVAAAMAMRTHVRNADYASEISIWSATARDWGSHSALRVQQPRSGVLQRRPIRPGPRGGREGH